MHISKRAEVRGLHILHDNASAHRSAVATEYLEEQYIKTLPHPAYSPGPEVIKIPFSIKLSMKFFLFLNVKMPTIFLLINVKMPTIVGNNMLKWQQFSCSEMLKCQQLLATIVGILTLMSRKNSILAYPRLTKKLNFLIDLYLSDFKFHAQLS